jgi:hypothetical protein
LQKIHIWLLVLSANLILHSTQERMKKPGLSWDIQLTKPTLQLVDDLWDDRNKEVHGNTVEEAKQQAREVVLENVRQIYKQPPKLAQKYPSILEVPLGNRL